MTAKGSPPKYKHGECSRCGGVRDEAGRYCAACRRAYQNERNAKRKQALERLKAIEGVWTAVTFTESG